MNKQTAAIVALGLLAAQSLHNPALAQQQTLRQVYFCNRECRQAKCLASDEFIQQRESAKRHVIVRNLSMESFVKYTPSSCQKAKVYFKKVLTL